MSKIVERTLDFLELFAREKRPLSLSDISRLLAIPVSSCHDVLQALQDRGFIYEIAPRCGYYPTIRIYELAKTIIENDPVVQRADLLLRELRDTLDETVLLAKFSGMSANYLLVFEATNPLRFHLRPGEAIVNLPLTSVGMAILGEMDEERRQQTIPTIRMDQLTPNTPKTIEALLHLVAVGRVRGYYVSNEHSIEGLTTISVPFSWYQSHYTITVAGPTARITSKMDMIVRLITQARHRLQMADA